MDSVEKNSSTTPSLSYFKRWLLAIRPKTLPAATAPVIAGTGAAIAIGQFRLLPALAALIGALLLQIGANLSNDVFDFQKGADTEHRLGPLRVTQAGLLTERQVYLGMAVTFGLAALIGVYLIWEAGWVIAAVGLLAILSAVAYTGGPYPLGYHGLGELFVFIFFGLAAVIGTVYVQARAFHPLALWTAIPMGLLTVNILIVNNLRDIETDRASGKRTRAVRHGEVRTRWEYVIVLAAAYAFPAVMALVGAATPWALLAWGSLPLAPRMVRMVFHETGRRLNVALAGTGQLELVYGILLGIGLALPRLLGS